MKMEHPLGEEEMVRTLFGGARSIWMVSLASDGVNEMVVGYDSGIVGNLYVKNGAGYVGTAGYFDTRDVRVGLHRAIGSVGEDYSI